MAHNLMNGNAYVGRLSAWHKLGTVTGEYLTFADIMAANNSALDYTVFKSQLHDGRGALVNAWATFKWTRADRTARNVAGAQFLGVVGEDYEVIQHAQGFSMVDALIASASETGAHYETAGALGNGERVWGLADLGLSISVGDDKQAGYLMFATGHDGSMSHQYRIVFTRVVCQNTLTSALSEKTRAKLTVRHTKNAQSRIADMQGTLASLHADTLTVEEKLRFLATRKVTRESMQAILDRLYPKPRVTDDAPAKDSSTRRDNVLASVLALYESNDANAFPEQKGTAYNLLNAITEHTDHVRTSRGDNRAESALFGTGDKLKSQALQVLYEAANGMPTVAQRTVYASAPIPPVSSGSSLLDGLIDATYAQ